MSDSTGSSEGLQPYRPTADHAFPDERVNEVLEAIENDEEVQAYLKAQNVNPVDRLGYNDHGPKHVEIVRDRALGLYDLLKRADVTFDAKDQGLAESDEPVIIALAATLHDVGHVVHRTDHTAHSIPLASDVLDRLLPSFYDVSTSVGVKAETLHAILCHHTAETPLTREAGVIRVADALDMERGRSRIPYDAGSRGINTISSRAIQQVSLLPGEETPVLVEIEMTDAAGVYQVDELLNAKLEDSLIEEFVTVVALHTAEGDDRLVERIEL